MKKIMQINITCGKGSTGKLAGALYEETIKSGYEAKFVYSAYTPTLPEAFRIENKLHNYLRRGLNKFFGRKQKHSNLGTKRLISYIKKEKPDLIHLHNVQQNSLNYIKFFDFLKKTKIKVVYTLHDCWAFTGGCFHFTKLSCEEYKQKCSKCPLSVHPDDITCSSEKAYALKKELIGGNNNISVVCVSNWLKNEASNSYMGDMLHKPQTIYNGINLDVFLPRKSDIRSRLGIPEDAFVILSAASFWTEGKGLNIFKELSQVLSKNTVIVLAGSGLSNINREYKNIICVDKTNNQIELAELYSAADVFINGSIEETFGLTTAEAISCGTPAIVFNSTACPEVVDETTGIVIEKDLKELVAAIEEIKNKGKLFYSKACINRVKRLFDEKIMLQNYIDLYRGLLDE